MIDNLLPPLSAEAYAALRDDIRENGVQVAITVDQDGNIIDGHHRSRAAQETGQECPRQLVATADDDDAIERQIALNELRRGRLTPPARQALAARLAERGWSGRRIARVLGVAHTTVQRDGSTGGANVPPVRERAVDARGRRQPKRQLSMAELEARRDEAVALYRQGYTQREIGQRLDVSAATVGIDLKTRGVEAKRRPRARDVSPPPPPPPSKPAHRRSVMVPNLEGQARAMRAENTVAQIAYDARDAFEQDDAEWIARAQAAARGLLEYMQRVADAVGSLEGARRHLEDRDDLAAEPAAVVVSKPSLKVVQ